MKLTGHLQLGLGLCAVLAFVAVARSQQPAPTLPDSVLSYEVQGISMKTDPAAVHGILLGRGFKRVPNNQPPAPGEWAAYERNFSRVERRGERITYQDKLSGAKEPTGGGGRQYFRRQRNITYQRLMPLENIAMNQQSWSTNSDKSWVKPLFDAVCDYGKQLNNRDVCARDNWRLLANAVPGVSVSLTQFETSVNFSQAILVQ